MGMGARLIKYSCAVLFLYKRMHKPGPRKPPRRVGASAFLNHKKKHNLRLLQAETRVRIAYNACCGGIQLYMADLPIRPFVKRREKNGKRKKKEENRG